MIAELATQPWGLLAVITLVAGVLQSATGFGFALVAVPLFLLVLDSLAAIQVNIVLNLFNALVVAPRIWRLAPSGLLRTLVGGTLLGLPLGMLAYLHADLDMVKTAVALLIMVFAIRLLYTGRTGDRRVEALRPPSAAVTRLVGGVSGAMTSSLAMPGPPVLIYLAHLRLDKDQFRATNLTLYVVAYGCALALQASLGDMTTQTWTLSLTLIPLAALGGWAGHRLSPRLSEGVFRRIVLLTLMITGSYMLFVQFWSGYGSAA